ncbi:MAG TPA: hypothetical protein VK485_07850, partial [Sphingomicrobium sp.]|nr:hypothetical protein [Sphingomicrobium sp.]
SWNCSSGFDFDGGRCNDAGLSATGRSLLKLMADYGTMIDSDHMSVRAKAEAMSTDFGLGPYPFVSSHTGLSEILHGEKRSEGQIAPAHLDRMIQLGGAFAPILMQANSTAELGTYPDNATVARHECAGTTESFIQTYRFLVEKLSKSKAFVGIGFGYRATIWMRTARQSG